ncbi:phage head closure protein [Candidatus Pantoea multigeneris]|uniref:Phage head closure protein n=1 Tax=Candidatus Pantoea multigeneris TaxID=2608357 RepID=A0ABX0R894_9GAMM|nr:phage head closure protein [Pantoea multigeneris]NIF20582.1 phage head closure protein [Pantoea multigeneris]
MKAGPMRYRVTLQKPGTGRLPSGQPGVSWVDVISVRADITDISGREIIAAGAELSGTTARIWIRKIPGVLVKAGWRVLHLPPTGNGEVYTINSAIKAENGARLELLCEEGVKS